MENVEVPEYFICPISLQIMKDPVTTTSGITYERDSIEQWLFKNHNTICPVTKQPLPENTSLTPNHTLRRLIHAWCTLHASYGVDRIPTPNTPLTKFYVINLMRDLTNPDSEIATLRKLELLVRDCERNRVYMVEAGLGKTLINFITACRRKGAIDGLEEALSILCIIRVQLNQPGSVLNVNDEIIDSLMWIFDCDRFRDDKTVKSHAACVVNAVVLKAANNGILERLKSEFFRTMSRSLRGGMLTQQGANAVLHLLLEACPWGRNRVVMVESGTVFDLIEVELKCPEKKTTELVLGILYHLCSCADGRAQLLSHAAGIAVVTRRILNVSAAADERALSIIWQISKYSATNGVLQEMLRVGTAANLCLVMLADTSSYLKEKAKKILRRHFDAWKDSPCIEMATLTRYTS